MSDLLQRILAIIPWVFIGWLAGRGITGEMDGLLVFVLVLILIPVAIGFNIFLMLVFKGRAVFKSLKQMQQEQGKQAEPLKSKNYADLPWWNPKRWM